MGVELAAELSQPFPHGGGQTTMAVKIIASEKQRPATRHVVLLVDTSTSMRRGKIQYARTGILRVLDELKSDDRLSIISFESSKHVHVESTIWGDCDHEKIREIVAGTDSGGEYDGELVANGGTRIKQGLEEAWDQFDENDEVGSRNVILLSDMRDDRDIDGLKNVAIGMRDAGISVSAGGIGRNYNEEVLLAIAEASGGESHHLEEESDIETFLRDRAREAKDTVASSPTLEVEFADEYVIPEDKNAYFTEPQNQSTLIQESSDVWEIDLSTLRVGKPQALTFEVLGMHQPTGLSWDMGELRVTNRQTLATVKVEAEHEDEPVSKERIEKRHVTAKVTESIKDTAVDKQTVKDRIDEIEKERGWSDTADELRKRLEASGETGGKINISKRRVDDEESD
jgi:Ca-activated chloride channel family protein